MPASPAFFFDIQFILGLLGKQFVDIGDYA